SSASRSAPAHVKLRQRTQCFRMSRNAARNNRCELDRRLVACTGDHTMLKSSWKFVALGLFAALSMSMTLAGDTRDLPAKSIRPDMGKTAESTTSVKMPEPNFGYEGHLGCFVATAQGKARGMIVVHQYPDTAKIALGNTKLTYEGTTQLNNVSGYVFK